MAITLAGVAVGYPGSGDVLHGIDAHIDRAQLVALVGPNGSGKSTLLRTIAGLVPRRAGSVALDGRSLDDLTRAERARVLAFVPQRTEIAFGFSVREVVMMGRAPYQGAFLRESARDREAVDEALDACELGELAHRPIAELSGGEQQRVHIARAVAQEPRILLLDEPAAHLDVRHQEDLYRVVRGLIERREVTCVAAMHDLNAALRHADRALLLDRGELAGQGPVEEVLEPALLSRVFGVGLGRAGRVITVTSERNGS